MALKTPVVAFLAALFLAVLVLPALGPVVTAQSGDSEMSVDGTMMMSGLTSLDGSGDAKVTFKGDAALELRHGIFNNYDASHDQSLNGMESNYFLSNVSTKLIGKIYWGMTIKSATNFTGKAESYISSHSEGLVNSRYNDNGPLSFTISFEGSGVADTKTIEAAQDAYDTFAVAVAEATVTLEKPTGYQFNGTLSIHQRVTTFAIGSFTSPSLTSSGISSLRNPLGEVVWYSYNGTAGPTHDIPDSLIYEGFTVFENQQISFIVLLLGLVMILRMPGREFDKYEKLHPRKFRKYAKPLASVKISSIVVAIVLVVLYLFPFAFSFLSKNAMFYAAYLYILVPVALIGEHLFSKSMYNKAALSIPDESIIEVKQADIRPQAGEGEILCKICYRPIDAGLEMFQCSCGMTMHTECAEKAQNCPNCGEPLFQQRTRSIQCRACGETFIYSGEEDPYSIQCTKCGAFQEETKAGKNYLIAWEDPRNAFMMIRAMFLSGRPTMILTMEFQGKIRADYDLRDIPIKRFSDSSSDIDNVNPSDLEGDSMEIVSTFLMTTKAAGVMLDGIEQLTEINGFEKVLAFVKRLNDLAAIHGSTIIVAVNKKGLTEDQFKMLSDEFDEIHDYQ
jgi:hypothetical protein